MSSEDTESLSPYFKPSEKMKLVQQGEDLENN